jgi:hypothetical protein
MKSPERQNFLEDGFRSGVAIGADPDYWPDPFLRSISMHVLSHDPELNGKDILDPDVKKVILTAPLRIQKMWRSLERMHSPHPMGDHAFNAAWLISTNSFFLNNKDASQSKAFLNALRSVVSDQSGEQPQDMKPMMRRKVGLFIKKNPIIKNYPDIDKLIECIETALFGERFTFDAQIISDITNKHKGTLEKLTSEEIFYLIQYLREGAVDDSGIENPEVWESPEIIAIGETVESLLGRVSEDTRSRIIGAFSIVIQRYKRKTTEIHVSDEGKDLAN